MRTKTHYVLWGTIITCVIIFAIIYATQDGRYQEGKMQELVGNWGLQLDTTNFQFDGASSGVMRGGMTTDGEKLYIKDGLLMELNLTTGRVSPNCNRAGCAHNSYRCDAWQRSGHEEEEGTRTIGAFRARREGIYYTSGNQLCVRRDNQDIVLYENTYYTDYEKEIRAEDSTWSDITIMCQTEDKLYFKGASYFRSYELSTGVVSEPIPFAYPERSVVGGAVCGTRVYYINMLSECFYSNLDGSGFVEIEGDMITEVSAYDEEVYCSYLEDDQRYIGRILEDGTIVPVVKDGYVNYTLTEDYLYYQIQGEESYYVHRVDHNGEGELVLDLSTVEIEGETYQCGGGHMFSAKGIRACFFHDITRKLLYIYNEADGSLHGVSIPDYKN